MPVRGSTFNVIDTWRMYETYWNEARTRGWHLWPYYLHVVVVVEAVVLGFVILTIMFVRT